MPFIDDALLWCPDNDGRLVGGLDLATCIADDSTVNAENINPTVQTNALQQQQQQHQLQLHQHQQQQQQQQQQLQQQHQQLQQQLQQQAVGNQELNGSAARNVNVVLEPLCGSDSSDELFRTLSESNFEIESLLSDLATVEVKVENEENNNNVINDNDFASAVVVASDDLLAKENVQLSVQGLVESALGASLADSNNTNGQAALLGFGSNSGNNNNNNSAAAKRTGFLLPCDLLNNNNNNNSSSNGDCTPDESRFVTVTSASANPLLVEKLMSKCLNIDKRLDKLDGKSTFKFTLYSQLFQTCF